MRQISVPGWASGPASRIATAGGPWLRRVRTLLARIAGWLRMVTGLVGRLARRVPRRVRRGAAVFAVAVAGILLGIQFGGYSTSDVGPFRVDFAVRPAWTGDAQLQIPPLGAITIDSHDGPARLTAQIRQLDEQRTRELIDNPQQIESASNQAADDVGDAVTELAINAALAAVTGGLLLGLVVFRSVRRAALTGVVALGVVVGTAGVAAATWSPQSIREPRYEGLLANVPAVIGNANSIYDRYGEYRGELIRIVTNMSRVYTNISTLPVYQQDPNTIRVLHITDLHLNPTSYEVIGAIADQFQVNAIVDTGDLTDWGSKLENPYSQSIGKLGVPYVFIRGNHDSPQTAAAVAAQPNAVVLDDTVRDVAGLTFAGIGDPRFTPDKSGGDLGPNEDLVIAAGETLAGTVAAYNAQHAPAGGAPPTNGAPSTNGSPSPPPRDGDGAAAGDAAVDVMLIHDPRGAEALAEAGPLVLAGHTHKRKVSQLDDDTTLMVEGSTGARGLRGIGEKDPTPLQMSLLYFTPSGQLQAYDAITVSGAGQSKVELERTIVANR